MNNIAQYNFSIIVYFHTNIKAKHESGKGSHVAYKSLEPVAKINLIREQLGDEKSTSENISLRAI